MKKMTAYFRWIRKLKNKNKQNNRDSSSSKDQVDTSDEMLEMDVEMNECCIADCEQEANRMQQSLTEDPETLARKEASDMIQEAEASKARILNTSGKKLFFEGAESPPATSFALL